MTNKRFLKRLIAYVACRGEPSPRPEDLRDFLLRILPQYAIPSDFIKVDRLPLTPNGKLDRRALALSATPARAEANAPNAFAPPATATEQLLAGIWSELLGVERVGLEASFFDLGGHSLLATRLVSRLRRTLHVDLPLTLVFQAPTLRALSEAVEATRKSGDGRPEAIARVAREPRRATRDPSGVVEVPKQAQQGA